MLYSFIAVAKKCTMDKSLTLISYQEQIIDVSPGGAHGQAHGNCGLRISSRRPTGWPLRAANQAPGAPNFSFQRMRPVICITTNSVRMDPMVITRPVRPLKKKA